MFSLEIREQEGLLFFVMHNNGKLVSEDTCREIAGNMKESAAHGLSMIYQKLRSVYGEDFSVGFTPGKQDGIIVTIMIPAKTF